jgi:hypothetical protein
MEEEGINRRRFYGNRAKDGTPRARMSARMAWKLRQIVHLYNFYKGDPIEMSTERARGERHQQPEHLHHHLHPQTLATAISISISTITTIVLPHVVHTCNRALHKASIVRHICSQSISKTCSSMFPSHDLISMCE